MDATRAQTARARKPAAQPPQPASADDSPRIANSSFANPAICHDDRHHNGDHNGDHHDYDAAKHRAHAAPLTQDAHRYKQDLALPFLLFVAALALRFYRIDHPAQVVFDEVHFGKFAAHYLKREYYFDVHPPLAKLLNAAAGYLAGFDGSFEFDNIGDDYIANNVPYIKMRAFPAIIGSLQVPLIYSIMRQSGYAPAIAAFSATLLLFDNAHIAQDRLILLDAPLILFMMLSFYSYIRFYKLRYNDFTPAWWGWLAATGLSLALTMSCKMVGLFTFVTIGGAVLFDLWNIMDIRRGHSMAHLGRHFLARTVCLVVMPFFVYLFWFWVHFAILTKSGPGDSFMSSEFQQSLAGNPLLSQAREIHYFDRVNMMHKHTHAYLHSHPERWPLKYDDGRISSNGQQVTAYPHNDTNNLWQILPSKVIDESDPAERAVKHKDVIRLFHVNTQTFLMTHDVASPLMATNEEFTTVPANDTAYYDNTLFELHLEYPTEGEASKWKSKSSWFRLIHVQTRVCMWTHSEALPEWGFKQQEVNGNKNAMDRTGVWFVDDLWPEPTAPDYEERIKPMPPKEVTPMPFIKKWIELQIQMLAQNNGLTQSHPYASGPVNWPFLLQGISFWTQDEGQKQIYMIGNLVSWWGSILSISVFTGIVGADILARRRGLYPIPSALRGRLHKSVGFFVGAWAAHYLPFFLMNRQLFIHHYLPAHVCACMVAGGVANFVLTETVDFPVSKPGPGLTRGAWRPRMRNHVDGGSKAVLGLVVLAMVACFWHLSPLTYGTPGLTSDEVNSKRLLSSWTLHFAK